MVTIRGTTTTSTTGATATNLVALCALSAGSQTTGGALFTRDIVYMAKFSNPLRSVLIIRYW